MDRLWTFLIYGLPAEVQAIILVLIALGALALIGMSFGWNVVRQIALPVLGAIGAVALASKIRQQGYTDRRAEEEKALDKAEEIVDDERKEVERLPDVELDQQVDKWTRP